MLAAILIAPEVLSPYDSRIVYVGRFDRRSSVGPIGSWPAVEARLRVKGAGVRVTVQESGHDWLQVVVDGMPTRAVRLVEGVQTIDVSPPKPGLHTYEFVKRTEPLVGTTQFLEFEPDRGRLLRAERRKRHIELVGDSITCGYGNEAPNEKEHFSPDTENAYLSYGEIAAGQVDADADIIAWSGRKMWPDNTVPSIYDLNVPTDPTSAYNFAGAEPEAVVINLGTNDFGPSNPDESEWVGAYKGFLARVRNHYPKAFIYVAIGSMMSDDYPPDRRALTTIRGYLTRMVDRLRVQGDRRIKLLEFDQQKAGNGYGADWHPSVATDRIMAAKLVGALKRDLRW